MPLHTWLPDAGAEAPIGAGVLLVGVLDKVGTFGFLRYCLPLFPLGQRAARAAGAGAAVIGILYGALLAVGQKDMKRFVAYTSIAHFGFIALAIFAFSTQAFAGAVLYMVNHGLSTGMLFVMVGLLVARGGSRHDRRLRRRRRSSPRCWPGCFLLAGLSSLALPGTNSFVSEFLVLRRLLPARAGVHDPRHRRHHLRRPVRALGLPADDAGPAARRGRPRRRSSAAPCAGGPGAMVDPAIAAAQRRASGSPTCPPARSRCSSR